MTIAKHAKTTQLRVQDLELSWGHIDDDRRDHNLTWTPGPGERGPDLNWGFDPFYIPPRRKQRRGTPWPVSIEASVDELGQLNVDSWMLEAAFPDGSIPVTTDPAVLPGLVEAWSEVVERDWLTQRRQYWSDVQQNAMREAEPGVEPRLYKTKSEAREAVVTAGVIIRAYDHPEETRTTAVRLALDWMGSELEFNEVIAHLTGPALPARPEPEPLMASPASMDDGTIDQSTAQGHRRAMRRVDVSHRPTARASDDRRGGM